jgi:hypothetical protein
VREAQVVVVPNVRIQSNDASRRMNMANKSSIPFIARRTFFENALGPRISPDGLWLAWLGDVDGVMNPENVRVLPTRIALGRTATTRGPR